MKSNGILSVSSTQLKDLSNVLEEFSQLFSLERVLGIKVDEEQEFTLHAEFKIEKEIDKKELFNFCDSKIKEYKLSHFIFRLKIYNENILTYLNYNLLLKKKSPSGLQFMSLPPQSKIKSDYISDFEDQILILNEGNKKLTSQEPKKKIISKVKLFDGIQNISIEGDIYIYKNFTNIDFRIISYYWLFTERFINSTNLEKIEECIKNTFSKKGFEVIEIKFE